MTGARHGDGAAPSIAGDPASFPTDAEFARTLVESSQLATLSTLTSEGYPYGSLANYSFDGAGNLIVLVSEMAEHTINARQDPRASALVAQEGDGDPLGRARLTLVGQLRQLDDDADVRTTHLERHPTARFYVDFPDFSFWKLEVETARFVGGFGHMSWVDVADYHTAQADPLADVAAGVVEHMNDDHADANLTIAQVLAELPDATEAIMTGIDRYGITLRATLGDDAARLARLPFPSPLTSGEEARPAIIALLTEARTARE